MLNSSMRYRPGETLESWAERVRTYELERARKRIASGEDAELVMTEMAGHIARKLLHPMLVSLRQSS
jgi:glutamyl-tRNA reductase